MKWLLLPLIVGAAFSTLAFVLGLILIYRMESEEEE